MTKKSWFQTRIMRKKTEGHQLLDEYIKISKKSRNEAYLKLSNSLYVKEYLAHFGKMKTIEDVDNAIDALQRMIKNHQNKYGIYADRETVKKELRKVRIKNEKRWWKKLYYIIFK